MEALAFEPQLEMRICKDCGRSLESKNFRMTKYGYRASVCTECATEKMRANKFNKSIALQNKGNAIVHDEEFDSKQPREVIDMMSRAKRRLESRGYTITLKGEYREVKVHTIKF